MNTLHQPPQFRQRVESSSLASIGYNPWTRTLEVEFRKGGVYRYLDVPPTVYRTLMNAPSKGRFFGVAIRNRFRFLKTR